MTTLKSFSTRATPNYKKNKIRAFSAKLRGFFPGALIWNLLFSFEMWATARATIPPLRLSRARSRETARSPFSDTVFTMKTLFYSNHCKLCIKYKSLTAIPDFENDDILFIYGAMACFKKKDNFAPNAPNSRWLVFQWTLFDFNRI